MEVFKDLLSIFKEIFYDIFGYLFPGIFILFILYIPVKIGQRCSVMYAVYEVLFNSDIKFKFDFINSSSSGSWKLILCILFLSYLLGHISIYMSSFFKPVAKLISLISEFLSSKSHFFKSILTSKNEYKNLCDNILEILKRNYKFRKDLFAITQKKEDGNIEIVKDYCEDFISTFASTYSRFTGHNDLIQKYICKKNFYNSLSCIFFILFVDSIVSFFIWKGLHPCNNINFLDLQIFIIIILLFVCFLTFLSQYNKHCNLKKKECYLFLYEYFNKK